MSKLLRNAGGLKKQVEKMYNPTKHMLKQTAITFGHLAKKRACCLNFRSEVNRLPCSLITEILEIDQS